MSYRIGDHVVYCKSKVSTHPGPRAREVYAAEHGEHYNYLVEKYWTVADIRPDGTLVLATRRGKRHECPSDDPNLRPANLLESVFFRHRFPRLPAPVGGTAQ